MATPHGHGLGWKRRPGARALAALPPPGGAGAAVPSVVDLRHLFLPAFDQGQYNTCTANAFAAIVEHTLLKQHTTVPYHRSRLYCYHYSGEIEGNVGDVGRDPRDVLAAIELHGIPPERDWPYQPATLIGATPSVAARAAAGRRKILMAYEMAIAVGTIKQSLAYGYAVSIAMPLWANFESEEVAQTGVVPKPAGAFLGYHDMVIGGYCDVAIPGVPAESLLVLNSWGAGFGASGWVFLPYGFVGAAYNGQVLVQELIAVETVTP